MSYKHNNLMAMRQNYWNDSDSTQVINEKQFFQTLLADHDIFTAANLDDAKYFFFSLPSIIIVKGYALGFSNSSVKKMLEQFIVQHKTDLQQRISFKIAYRM